MSKRRRSRTKPLIPGLRWLLLIMALLTLLFGVYGLLSQMTHFERNAVRQEKAP